MRPTDFRVTKGRPEPGPAQTPTVGDTGKAFRNALHCVFCKQVFLPYVLSPRHGTLRGTSRKARTMFGLGENQTTRANPLTSLAAQAKFDTRRDFHHLGRIGWPRLRGRSVDRCGSVRRPVTTTGKNRYVYANAPWAGSDDRPQQMKTRHIGVGTGLSRKDLPYVNRIVGNRRGSQIEVLAESAHQGKHYPP